MKKTLMLAASFLVLISVSAFAEGPYIAGDLGLAIVHDSDIKPVGRTTETAAFDTGIGFDIAVGHSFKHYFRAEGEFGYRSVDVDTVDGVNPGGTNSLGVMSLMANGYYDFSELRLPVTPYAGLGLGFLNGKFKTNISGAADSYNDTVFGYQLMLGASYPINRNVSVNAGYKLQGAFNDFEGSIGGNKFKVSYTSSNLLVGARYNF